MSAGILDKYFIDAQVPDNLNKADIKCIRDWLSKQRHLPELSDRQIAIFLHSCFGALELTKTTIDSYYTIRTHAPDLFDGRNPKEVAETNTVLYCVQLDEVCPDGCRIVLLGLYNPDPSKFSLLGYLRSLFCSLDILYNEHSFDKGLRIVYDMTGAGFGHLAKFHVSVLKKAFMYLQDGLPLRLKGIHIFNAIPLVNQFLAIVKPIMKKELYQLIHVHSTNDIESLFEYIPKECLPSNFGGKAPSVDDLIKISNQKVEKYKQWFIDDDKYGRVDESKRAGKAKNSGDIFGFDGSFKKLDFD